MVKIKYGLNIFLFRETAHIQNGVDTLPVNVILLRIWFLFYMGLLLKEESSVLESIF